MKKILMLFAFAGIMSFSIAEAAKIEECVVTDFENSIITVAGIVEEGDGDIVVAVIPKETELDSGKYSGETVSFQDTEIDVNKFSVSFKFLADEGIYTVNATNAQSIEFEWIEKESVLKFVDNLGDGKISDNMIYDELLRHSLSLGVDISFADNSEEKEYLVGNVQDYSSRIKENGIEGVKTIATLTRSELEFMEKLSNALVSSTVNELIDEYSVGAEIDVTKYNKLSTNQKGVVCEKFIEADYSDMKEFRKDFKEAVETANEKPTSNGNSGGSSGGSSGGFAPSNTGLPISTTTGQYKDDESAKDVRLFEIFTDVEDVSWAWESILYTYDNGIMSGVGNKLFKPNDVLTREQFAKIITLAFNKYDEHAVPGFSDVDTNSWASSYIASAKNSGLMKGISESEFGYGKGLARQDICVVIYRAAKECGMTFEKQKTDFSDYEEISDYAKEAVSCLAGKGIISGMGDGNFSPKGQATRAQATKLIYAVLGGNV